MPPAELRARTAAPRAWPRLALAVALAVAPVHVASVASAQTLSAAELEHLRKRFFEAIELEERGAWAEAREIFREIAPKRTSPQVRYHIALCDENLGKLADALRGYEDALEMAKAEQSDAAAPVIENAEKRLGPLRPRVPKLRIVRGNDDRRAVRIDGTMYLPHQLGEPLLLDPGEHRVEVAASGGFELVRVVKLAEGDDEELELDTSSKPAPEASTVRSKPVAPPPAVEPPSGSRAPAVVVGTIGVLGLAGSGVLYGLSQVAAAEVKDGCPGWETGVCPTALQARAEEGATLHTTSIIVGAASAATIVTAVVLWVVLEPEDPAPPRAVTVLPWAITSGAERAPSGAGAIVEARF